MLKLSEVAECLEHVKSQYEKSSRRRYLNERGGGVGCRLILVPSGNNRISRLYYPGLYSSLTLQLKNKKINKIFTQEPESEILIPESKNEEN